MSESEFIIRVGIDGDSEVGKTCIVNQYLYDTFVYKYTPTLGVDISIKECEQNNTNFRLHVWDLSGKEKYRLITKNYYRDLHGLLLVYDVSNPNSFSSVKSLIYDFQNINQTTGGQIMILGNLKSNDRKVSYQEAHNFALEKGLQYIEVNACNSEEVKIAVQHLINCVLCGVGKIPPEETSDQRGSYIDQLTSFLGRVGHSCCLGYK